MVCNIVQLSVMFLKVTQESLPFVFQVLFRQVKNFSVSDNWKFLVFMV